jgi:quinoprotein glucose dehydrogenase
MSRKHLLSASALALIAATFIASEVFGQLFVGTPTPAQYTGQGQPSTAKGEWPTNAGDIRGTRYSPLDQINAQNFNRLQVAWRFKTDAFGPYPEWKLEGTPIMVKGVLYTTAGTRRSVIALDAKTGELIWSHSLREGKRAAVAPRQLSGRGVSYWTDGQGDERIIYITTGYRMVELNPKTGQLIDSFGDHGIVDLKVGVYKGNHEQIDLETGEVGVHSTATVVNNIAIVGASFKEGATVETHNNTKGVVRAYDVRTGRLVWRFNTIPEPGEFGNETWENGSWATNGNTGVWNQISADPELGLVYLPVETPTSDYYGGARPGNNLYAESLVAVDINTGQRKWHFQFTHHPVWNFDMSAMPILADVTVAGRARKVVAQPTKQGWLYVFDRATGEPIWPIVEKPVPVTDVAGEKSSPTQPFPPDALRYNRSVETLRDDLIDFTPQLKTQAAQLLTRYRFEPSPFTPGSFATANGKLGSIVLGTATNWPGGGYDPELHIAFMPAGNVPGVRALRKVPAANRPGFKTDLDYVAGVDDTDFSIVYGPGDCCAADNPVTAQRAKEARENAPLAGGGGEGGGGLNVRGLPIVKPPYGLLAAVDLDKGELKWQTPHGDTPDNVRNNPALQGINIGKTGQPGTSGVGLLVTKTLVVMGDPQSTTASGKRGAFLRAYDKVTGREVGAVYMPAQQSGTPMTYSVDGKQYIIVAISDPRYSGEYLAFSLPN